MNALEQQRAAHAQLLQELDRQTQARDEIARLREQALANHIAALQIANGILFAVTVILTIAIIITWSTK